MDEREYRNDIGWLTPDLLFSLLDELRENGFCIGISQYIACQDIILFLTTESDRSYNFDQIENFLGPILCTNPKEQIRFRKYFSLWRDRVSKINATRLSKTIQDGLESPDAFVAQFLNRVTVLRRGLLIGVIGLIALVLPVVLTNARLRSSTVPELDASTTPSSKDANNLNTVQVPPPSSQATSVNPANIVVTPRTPKLPESPIALQEAFVFCVLVLLLTLLLWRIWWLFYSHQFLNRFKSEQEPDLSQISVSNLEGTAFSSTQLSKLSRKMRERVSVSSNRIDVTRTIEKVIEEGGLIQPVYSDFQIIPEYIFLIDKTNYKDHQAQLFEVLTCHLRRNEVFIKSYFFDGNPQVCVDYKGEPIKLRSLLTKLASHRFFFFVDADSLISSTTGRLEPWLARIKKKDNIVVLTPRSVGRWRDIELKVIQQFTLIPATAEGILSLYRFMTKEERKVISLNFENSLFHQLYNRPFLWISRSALPLDSINKIFLLLRNYLGSDGFYWLSACAVFPEINWRITIYLGSVLTNEFGKPLLRTSLLNELSRLPWFRHGYMPVWIRLYLISTLGNEKESEVRLALYNLLLTVSLQGDEKNLTLDIAREHPNIITMLSSSLFNRLLKSASPRSSLKDFLFVGFMNGSSRLSVEVQSDLDLFFHYSKDRTFLSNPRGLLSRVIAFPMVAILSLVSVATGISQVRSFDIYSEKSLKKIRDLSKLLLLIILSSTLCWVVSFVEKDYTYQALPLSTTD